MANVLIRISTILCVLLTVAACQTEEKVTQSKVTLCKYEEGPVLKRALSYKNKKEKAKLLALRDSLFREENALAVEKAYLSYRVGQLYDVPGGRSRAIRQYSEALGQFLAADTVVLDRVIQMYFNIANNYFKLGIRDSSNIFANKGLDFIYSKELCDGDAAKAVYLYRTVGVNLRDVGDFAGSFTFFEKGAEICRTDTPRDRYCGQLMDGYAYALLELDRLEESKKIIKEGERYIANIDTMNYWDSKALVDIYETYFAIADKEGELKGAEVEVRKGLRLNIVLDSQSLSTGHSYNNLGRILIRGGEYKKGEAYLRKALSLYRLNEHYTDQGTCYENFSKSSLFQGDTLAALGYLDSAATAYHGFPESPSLAFALDKQQLKDPIFSQAELMSTLHLSRPDAFPLESVIESVARVDSIIGFLRYGVRSELSKRQAIAELRALYDGLINFSYQQWQKTGDEKYQQLGISYLERGKAQILQERQRRTLNEEDGQNTESLQEVRDLRENIYALKGRLRKTKDVKTRREIGEKINRQELQMYKKQEEIYQSKTSVYEYDGQFIGLEGISKTLEADEIVLDYFLGDETGYVALATKEGVEIKRLPLLTDSLVGMVKRLGTCLAAPGEGRKWSNDRPWREGKEKERLNLSFRLYESLVASVLPNHSDYQRITIIPDGILAFLPFGALLTEEVPAERPTSEDKLPYLLVSHTVNYEFSAGIWRDRLESAYTGGTKALVIAPVQEKGRSIEMAPSGKEISLAALGYVAQEVDAVEKHIRSDVWRGPEACELVEKAEFGSYGVVHFSGHGEVFPDNISQSFLVLDLPEKGVYCLLRLPDLEAKKLNVDLLVLSACRTGEGELAQEEGVISLSRAGAIAGARSVVSSLWVANQASKAELFDRFYEQLAAGDRRDEALRGAKLHFLGSGEGFEHPYYWAAFLNTGSSKVLEASFVQ